MKNLTIGRLKREAEAFATQESTYASPELYGITDGKAVGTYFEHKFQKYLHEGYEYDEGSSAKGIDFPGLGVDMKVTSVAQPQRHVHSNQHGRRFMASGIRFLFLSTRRLMMPIVERGGSMWST